jgi:predicted O-linked N-acetylglucosamine transferase (SPINDLY family)
VVRLPETAWCFSPLSGEPRIGELPALGSGRVTFGSLNNLAKVSGATLDLWAAVLGRVAGSRLILKSLALGEKDTAERYRRSFAERGIAPERLDFRPHAASPAEHLSTYAQIDVALDTFPYHGTTTTCEALWMGVPVITLAGERHASRVGVSLLTHVGLADLVAHGTEEYAELARGLAEDLARLAQIRGTLRERMRQSPLMGGPRLARCVEAAYRTMWRWWCQRGAEKRGV